MQGWGTGLHGVIRFIVRAPDKFSSSSWTHYPGYGCLTYGPFRFSPGGYRAPFSSVDDFPPAKTSQIKYPSNAVLLADSFIGSSPQYGYYVINNSTSHGADPTFASRHTGMTNILFADGHVASKRTDLLIAWRADAVRGNLPRTSADPALYSIDF